MNTTINLVSTHHNLNTVFKAASYSQDLKLTCAAVANLVAIQDYSSQVPATLFTLKAHSGRVNAVRWLGKDIISISDAGDICLWRFHGDPRSFEAWTCKQQQTVSKLALNYLSELEVSPSERFFATMGMDGTLRLFRSDEGFVMLAELLFGKNLQETMCLTTIGEKHLLLTVGGYDK